jgi:DNA-binding NarL/FixJ family response regulator
VKETGAAELRITGETVPRTTVLLADDDTIVAEALASLLEDEFDVVRTVRDGRQLIEAAKELKPAVIVTDISMPQHKETQFAVEAFRAGVSGYLLKRSAGDELVKAIQEVTEGRSYLTSLVTKDLISVLIAAQSDSSIDHRILTARQREILQLIAEGKTAKEIGGILKISTRTVEGHKYEIMDALGVKTSAELVQQAIKLGLITP